MLKFFAAVVVVATGLFAHAAFADTLTFVSSDGQTTISGMIPEGTPTSVVDGIGLAYYVPMFLYNGSVTSGYFGFYNPDTIDVPGADLAVYVSTIDESFIFGGVQLYTGQESSPVFRDITASLTGLNGNTLNGTVTVSTTPEPSSLVLLGTGVLSAGTVIRRRILCA